MSETRSFRRWNASIPAVLFAAAVGAQRPGPPSPVPPQTAGGSIKVERFTGSRPAPVADAAASRAERVRSRAADYYPLAAGATWGWEFVDGDGNESKERHETLATDIEADGGSCAEIRIEAKYPTYAYVSHRPDGVYRHKNAYLGDMRGVGRHPPIEALIKDPVAVGSAWTWTDLLVYQIEGSGSQPPEEETRFVVTSTIEALDDAVSTPKGTVPCLRVRTAFRGRRIHRDVTTWYAEGVGPVKSLTTDGAENPRVRRGALTSFTPGADEDYGDAAGELLAARNALDWTSSTASFGPAAVVPFVLEPFRSRFRARFFLVTSGIGPAPGSRALHYALPVRKLGPRLSSRESGELDGLVVGGWNALIEKGAIPSGSGSDGTQSVEDLTRALALAYAAARCTTFDDASLPGGATSEVSIAGDGTLTGRAAVSGKALDGSAFAAIRRATCREGRLVSIVVE